MSPRELESVWTDMPSFAAICLMLMPWCSITLACAVEESLTLSS